MLSLPLYAHLEVTDLCNLRCPHCFHSGVKSHKRSRDLEEDVLFQLVNILINNDIFALTLTGGEPFTKPDITLKILEIAKNAGIHVSINTNGLLLTEKIAQKLVDLQVDNLLVSCPSGDISTYEKLTGGGNYKTFKKNLKFIAESNIRYLVNTVVSKQNFSVLRQTVLEMANIGIKNIALTPANLSVHNPNDEMLLSPDEVLELFEMLRWAKEKYGFHVDSVEPIPKCFFPNWAFEYSFPFTRRSCVAGFKSISVSNTGEVSTCAHSNRSYGNLFDTPLSKIWSSMEDYRNNSTPSMCFKCSVKDKCHGGCRMFSMAKFGVANMPDRLAKGPITEPKLYKTTNKVALNSIYYFNGKLRYRKENDGQFSVTSLANGGNVMIVNTSLLKYIKWLSNSLPLKGVDILATAQSKKEQKVNIKILSKLLENKFIRRSE